LALRLKSEDRNPGRNGQRALEDEAGMIGLLTPQGALSALIAEYPFLENWGVGIVKQFEAGQGRISNAFLVSCQSSIAPVDCFVAKAASPHTVDSKGLVGEWRALRLAATASARCPDLLAPDHGPERFLLLEFLPGTDAEHAIDHGAAAETVFGRIGETLRQVHAVEAPWFGSLRERSAGRWEDSISARIWPKLQALKEILDPDLRDAAEAEVSASLPSLALEPDVPRLMHRDVYLSNFLVSETLDSASILDFGMAQGGRPFYDLAKLYILDLYRYPNAKNEFLSAYFGGLKAPASFKPLLKLYLYVELLGMIRFFDMVGQQAALDHAIRILRELIQNRGRIVDLLD
jgi:aminoglycoside phosphotransferase (APT) family kinase protein